MNQQRKTAYIEGSVLTDFIFSSMRKKSFSMGYKDVMEIDRLLTLICRLAVRPQLAIERIMIGRSGLTDLHFSSREWEKTLP